MVTLRVDRPQTGTGKPFVVGRDRLPEGLRHEQRKFMRLAGFLLDSLGVIAPFS
jgi:hypothetical protein